MKQFLEDISEETQKVIFFSIIAIGFILLIGSVWAIRSFDSNKREQTVTVERVTGKYQLISSTGPSPLRITVKEISTGKLYEDSFVSVSCPLYETKSPGIKELDLTRFTNIRITDNTHEYFFKGAYEQLCTNLPFNAKSGDNYYKGN